MPCKQRKPGAVPGRSTILFYSTHKACGIAVNDRERGSIPRSRATQLSTNGEVASLSSWKPGVSTR